MEKTSISSFKLMGLKLHEKTTNRNNQSSMDCGSLWQKFEEERIAEKIPNKMNEEVYAVYYDYEGGYKDPFSYFIGCKVDADVQPIVGLDILEVPKQDYDKLQAKGKMPNCIADSWRKIWESQMERAYTYDFEVYDERSRDWNNAELDIFIAVKNQ